MSSRYSSVTYLVKNTAATVRKWLKKKKKAIADPLFMLLSVKRPRDPEMAADDTVYARPRALNSQ